MRNLALWVAAVMFIFSGMASARAETASTTTATATTATTATTTTTEATATKTVVKGGSPKKTAPKAKKVPAKKVTKTAGSSAPVMPQPQAAPQIEGPKPIIETPVQPLDASKTEVPLTGYDKGFFIQNKDKSFIFKINGRFQPQVYFRKRPNQDSNWTFGIRRARIDFDGTVYTNTSFHITLQHSTSSELFTTMNVSNLAVTHTFAPEFAVSVGMVGLPLAIIDSRSSLGFQLTEAPIIVSQIDGGASSMTPLRSSFGSPSGLGISFEGTFFDKLYYNLSVVNGAAKATQTVSGRVVTSASGGQESDYDLNFNKKVSTGARIAYDIFDNCGGFEHDIPYSEKPKWTISVGGDYQGKRQDPNFTPMTDIDYIITGSLGTSFKYRGFAISAEAYGRKTKIGNPGGAIFYSDTMDDMAYYVDTGYFVVPDILEIAGQAAQIFREGPHNNSYEFGGGINYFPLGKPNLKLQLSYIYANYYLNISEEAPSKGQQATLMLTSYF